MTKEPVLNIASVQAVIGAVITALVVFGAWHPTEEQIAAVIGVYAVVAPLIFGLIARQSVSPVDAP